MKQESQEISVLKLFQNLLGEKHVLIGVPLFFVIIGILYAFSLPKEYESTASWVPQTSKPDPLYTDITSIFSMKYNKKNDENNLPLTDLLYSDDILKKLLKHKFNHSTLNKAIDFAEYLNLSESLNDLDSLQKKLLYKENVINFINTKITLTNSKIISLSVLSTDPLFSQEINQFLATELLNLQTRIKTDKTTSNRKFLENQYKNLSDSLYYTEEELLKYASQQLPENKLRNNLEKIRLQRKVDLFSSLSLEKRTQLELTRLEEEVANDLVLFLSKPSYARQALFPKKKIIISSFAFVGIIIAMMIAVFKIWIKEKEVI